MLLKVVVAPPKLPSSFMHPDHKLCSIVWSSLDMAPHHRRKGKDTIPSRRKPPLPCAPRHPFSLQANSVFSICSTTGQEPTSRLLCTHVDIHVHANTYTRIYLQHTHSEGGMKKGGRNGEREGGGKEFISEAEVQEFVLTDLLGDSDAHLSLRTMDTCNLKEISEQKVK